MTTSFSLIRLRAAFVALLVALPFLTFAQIPVANSSLETWTPRRTGLSFYQAPQYWKPGFFSTLLASFGQTPRFAKSPVAHSGNSSARITIGADSLGADLNTTVTTGGQPLTGASCWVRQSYTSTDPAALAGVLVFATRIQGGQVDTIGLGFINLPPIAADTWTQVQGPIEYYDPQQTQADSAIVQITYLQDTPGHQIFFDDFALLSTPMSAPADRAAAAPLAIGPNPVTAATTEAMLTVAVATATPGALVVTDALGRQVGSVRKVQLTSGDNRLTVPTHTLAAGVYTVRLVTPAGTRSGKLIRQ